MSSNTSKSPRLSRRQMIPAAAGLVGLATSASIAEPLPKELAAAVAGIEPYLFTQDKFGDVTRGTPLPHSISEEKRREVGLTRETWRLEVISDPENKATLGRELTKENGLALDFAG